MEELIQKYKLGELFEPVDINIIISANNRVLVEQTKNRMINDLATDSEDGANDACINGNVFSWTSGTKENNISPDALAFRLLDGQIEMVVICAHAIRLRYLADTIKSLASSRTFTKRINIWIDEADKSINLWSKYQNILTMRCINQATLVSATFDAVISKYKDLYVLPYSKTHPECYRGLSKSKRHEVNFVAGSALEYVRHVISNHDELAQPGMRAFIPGSNSTNSHDAIADFLHKEYKFVVIIINGKRKEILVPDQLEPIDLRCYFNIQDDQIPEEFNSQLAKLYKENNWSRFPLAITGYMCVQRGITFQCCFQEGVHDGFLFDYGIISPTITCAVEAYQTMARLFGNVGNIPGYKPVEIFSNFATFSRVEKQEEIAINIARIVYDQGLEVVTKKDIKAAQNFEVESKFELKTEEFRTLADATKFMRSWGAQGKTEKSLERNEVGFILSSTTGKKEVLNYNAVKKEMSAWSKTSNFDVKKEEPPKKSSGRLYICYKDTSDVSSVVFIPRVLVPKTAAADAGGRMDEVVNGMTLWVESFEGNKIWVNPRDMTVYDASNGEGVGTWDDTAKTIIFEQDGA
jgi:hypothetical protein